MRQGITTRASGTGWTPAKRKALALKIKQAWALKRANGTAKRATAQTMPTTEIKELPNIQEVESVPTKNAGNPLIQNGLAPNSPQNGLARTVRGWITVESSPGLTPTYAAIDEHRIMTAGRGSIGAIQAVEYWEAKLGGPVRLESVMPIGYRVYTEHHEQTDDEQTDD